MVSVFCRKPDKQHTMKHTYFFVGLVLILFSSCISDELSESHSLIRPNESGTFINEQGGYAYVAGKPDDTLEVTATSAIIKGSFSYVYETEHPIEEYGHCWSLSENPLVVESSDDYSSIETMETLEFQTEMKALKRETQYYVRSYIKTQAGYSYNPVTLTFKTAKPSNLWEQQDDYLGQPRFDAVTFTIADTAYVGLGSDGLEYRRDFWRYDNVNGWQSIATYGGDGRIGAAAFVVNNVGYVGTGESESGGGTTLTDFWRYDYKTNQWKEIAEFTGFSRKDAVAFSLKGKGYIGLGKDNTNLTDFYEYTPSTDKWEPANSFTGSARSNATAFVIRDSKAYVGLGEDQNGARADFYEFNPDDESWTTITSLPGGERYDALSFVVGTDSYEGYIISGTDGTTEYKDVWRYDAKEQQWEKVSEFTGVFRLKPIAFSLQDRAYFGLGKADEILNDFWMYLP